MRKNWTMKHPRWEMKQPASVSCGNIIAAIHSPGVVGNDLLPALLAHQSKHHKSVNIYNVAWKTGRIESTKATTMTTAHSLIISYRQASEYVLSTEIQGVTNYYDYYYYYYYYIWLLIQYRTHPETNSSMEAHTHMNTHTHTHTQSVDNV